MEWKLIEARKRKRVAVFASKSEHCLLDLLWRQRRGELPVHITMVVSNHPDLSEDVRAFGIPYFYVPVGDGTREVAEARHLELLQNNVDLVVLARYMQILTEDFIDNLGVPVINIHHSFLPAFIGPVPIGRPKSVALNLSGYCTLCHQRPRSRAHYRPGCHIRDPSGECSRSPASRCGCGTQSALGRCASPLRRPSPSRRKRDHRFLNLPISGKPQQHRNVSCAPILSVGSVGQCFLNGFRWIGSAFVTGHCLRARVVSSVMALNRPAALTSESSSSARSSTPARNTAPL